MLKGGRKRDAGLGDAMEAVIAAVYLDAGFDVARDRVKALWGERIAQVDSDARDAKICITGMGTGPGNAADPITTCCAPRPDPP